MIEINQYPKEIYDTFDKSAPKFLVCGIIKNAQGQYQFQSFHVTTMEELYFQIAPEQLVRFKVFEVCGQLLKVEGVLKGEAVEYKKQQEDKKELALYERLKVKYELTEVIN